MGRVINYVVVFSDPSEAPEFILDFLFCTIRVARILVFCVVLFQLIVYNFLIFLLAIVLSVLLRFTDSDYPFGILRLCFNSPCFVSNTMCLKII